MRDLTFDLIASQLVGVLASAAAVFLFLAILAFEWHRMELLRACREVAAQILARNEEIRAQREKKREERLKLAGLAPRSMAGALKKMMKGQR